MIRALPGLALLACAGEPPAAPRRCDGRPPDAVVALEHVMAGDAEPCELRLYLAALQDRGRHAGPWFEDLHVMHSADGVRFDVPHARKLFSKAAVPEAVRGDDGRVYLYFGEGDLERGARLAREGSRWFSTHGLLGYGACDLAVSEDGFGFARVPEFAIEGLVQGMVVDPDVQRLPDGRWRMYYIGLSVRDLLAPDAWRDGSRHQVWYAESEDLVHWRQVGLAVEGPNADPTVLCVDEARCLMFSTGLDLSVSDDGGRSFRYLGDQGLPGFAPKLLRLPDGSIRLYYNSKEKGGPLLARHSRDGGESWEDEGALLPPYQAEALAFAAAPQGGWLAYYHYWQEGLSGDSWVDGFLRRGTEPTPPPAGMREGGARRGPGPPPPGPDNGSGRPPPPGDPQRGER